MLYNINIELFYIVILISGIMCGYMVSDFPKEFLNLFTTPIGQFLTIFTIFFTIRRDLKIKIKLSSIIETIIISIGIVLLLQISKRIIRFIYSHKNK